MNTLPLEVRHVSKQFRATNWSYRLPWRRQHVNPSPVLQAVSDVSFSVNRGEIFGVIGANGSGKSTLIRIISTLLLPDDGTVTVFGRDVERQTRDVRQLINRVSADPSFFKTMSAVENLQFFGQVYGLTAGEIRTDLPVILARLGLAWNRAQEPMTNLSRGQQQKVAVARAFLTSPVLMLLDEPTTGLDPRSKRDVQAFVHEVQSEHDATILLTTHDMDEAEILCDRIAFLAGGRIVAEGTPADLRRRSADRLGLHIDDVTMETVFLDITGRRLDDDEEAGGERVEVTHHD